MKSILRSIGSLFSKLPQSSGDASSSVGDERIKSMLASVGEQYMRAEQAMDEARAHQVVRVRLAPQVPIRDVEQPRSWFGGAPAIAEDIAWPTIDGQSAPFLAQICCSDLPPDLWDGLGPRSGWLAIFMQPAGFGVIVLHLEKLGPWRQAPAPLALEGWVGLSHRLSAVNALPRWPVDVIAVRPGDPDPHRTGHSRIMHKQHAQGFDLRDPERQPFDRPTTVEMLELAEQRITARLSQDNIGPARRRLELAEAGVPVVQRLGEPAKPADPQVVRAEIAGLEEVRSSLEAALPRVQALRERFGLIADVTPADIAQAVNELGDIDIATWEGTRQPLTAHAARSQSLMAWQFETRRFDRCRHVYAAAPSDLPPAVREHFEALWKDFALHEMGSMGHVPDSCAPFDPQSHAVLLELPSSDLLGWTFGDVSTLVITIEKRALAAGRFDAVDAQVSN